MSSLLLSRLDHGNATLAGIPSYVLQQLQSVMNSAARLVFSSSRYDHLSPPHSVPPAAALVRPPERIQFKLAVLVYKCLHADELQCAADFETWRHLRTAFSLSLTVRRTRLPTVGDRAYPVVAARTWNSLPNMSRPHPLCLFSDVA